MKTIGVLGGMSWESSLDWYRMANQQVHERLGGYHSAPILLDSLDFAEIEALHSRQAYREVIGRLVEAGAEGIILGRTEIELLIAQSDSPAPVFPTTALHVTATLAAADQQAA